MVMCVALQVCQKGCIRPSQHAGDPLVALPSYCLVKTVFAAVLGLRVVDLCFNLHIWQRWIELF